MMFLLCLFGCHDPVPAVPLPVDRVPSAPTGSRLAGSRTRGQEIHDAARRPVTVQSDRRESPPPIPRSAAPGMATVVNGTRAHAAIGDIVVTHDRNVFRNAQTAAEQTAAPHPSPAGPSPRKEPWGASPWRGPGRWLRSHPRSGCAVSGDPTRPEGSCRLPPQPVGTRGRDPRLHCSPDPPAAPNRGVDDPCRGSVAQRAGRPRRCPR